MDKLGPIRAYCKTVEDSLVELFHFPRAKAREEIAFLRHRLDSKGSNTRSQQDIIYHAEPLHIAEDLSRTTQPEYEAFFDRYREIRDRYRKPSDTLPEPLEAVSRVPSLKAQHHKKQDVGSSRPELTATGNLYARV